MTRLPVFCEGFSEEEEAHAAAVQVRQRPAAQRAGLSGVSKGARAAGRAHHTPNFLPLDASLVALFSASAATTAQEPSTSPLRGVRRVSARRSNKACARAERGAKRVAARRYAPDVRQSEHAQVAQALLHHHAAQHAAPAAAEAAAGCGGK